jgi:hypothetical protein
MRNPTAARFVAPFAVTIAICDCDSFGLLTVFVETPSMQKGNNMAHPKH